MKVLLAAITSLLCVSAFAQTSAVDALSSIIKPGEYYGNGCKVSVNEVNFPERALLVTVTEGERAVSKLVADGSEFRLRAYKNEFIQTSTTYVDDSRTAFTEQIIRTVTAGDRQLYVVTSYGTVVNRESYTDIAECVVNL